MRVSSAILSLFLLAIIHVSISCSHDANCHLRISVVNNSDKAIYYHFSARFPDTSLNYNPVFNLGSKIISHQSEVYSARQCIESEFNITTKFMCFIWDAQTLETVPWDTILQNYLILKRYDLTLQDLDSLNWTITYP